ncbi:MAG: 5-carboxymethyl-2-hydroxymuconate Delta-isomerase [Fimbriimonadaceae bacterium]
MPHIHLQTSADLDENTRIPDVLDRLVAALCEIETIDPKAVKAYHSLRSVWAMGAGAQPGFATCEVAVLAGRPEAVRVKIADVMFAALQDAFSRSSSADEVNLTLEVREMQRATYRK